MKATGIIRRVDDLGRVVIPKEIRRNLHIREGEPLEIYTEHDGSVIFRKMSHDLVDDVKHLEEVLDAYLPIDDRQEQVYLKNLLGQVLEIVKRNVEECEEQFLAFSSFCINWPALIARAGRYFGNLHNSNNF